jgi:hypothetical protein
VRRHRGPSLHAFKHSHAHIHSLAFKAEAPLLLLHELLRTGEGVFRVGLTGQLLDSLEFGQTFHVLVLLTGHLVLELLHLLLVFFSFCESAGFIGIACSCRLFHFGASFFSHSEEPLPAPLALGFQVVCRPLSDGVGLPARVIGFRVSLPDILANRSGPILLFGGV